MYLDNISNKCIRTAVTITGIDFCKQKPKHDLSTILMFGGIFFIALFEEKVNKLLDQLNIGWISGIRPYQISGSTIWYPA
jgi:hypothetical protein